MIQQVAEPRQPEADQPAEENSRGQKPRANRITGRPRGAGDFHDGHVHRADFFGEVQLLDAVVEDVAQLLGALQCVLQPCQLHGLIADVGWRA